MSVVTRQARTRWAAVAAGIGLLVAVPTAVTAATDRLRTGPDDAAAPRELISRALASATVPFSGLAESRGDLGLPDLPQLETLAAQLGGTTRTRIWSDGTDTRTDVLTATGEQGIYVTCCRTVLWDYERATLTEVAGEAPLRLPRADDLTPPQAARRMLAGVGPGDVVTALEPGRTAGRPTLGVRIEPGDERSTIGRLDVRLDARTALPVRMDVVDATGRTSLSTRFTDLDLGRPDRSLVRPPDPPTGVAHDFTTTPDLISRLQRFARTELPRTLGGLPASDPLAGTVTYGTGLTRFAVQPLPGRLTDAALDAAGRGGGEPVEVPDGEAQLIRSGALTLAVVRPGEGFRGFLVAGLVTPEVMTEVARTLAIQVAVP